MLAGLFVFSSAITPQILLIKIVVYLSWTASVDHVVSLILRQQLCAEILQLPVVLNNNVLMINNDDNDDNDGWTISEIIILPWHHC